MSLLTDFKTSVGYDGSDDDQYFINHFIRPALDKVSENTVNLQQADINLVNGTREYDLKTLANPIVSEAGVESFYYDRRLYCPYRYKRDFYFRNRTALYFPDASIIQTGKFTFKYNAHYSTPDVSDEYIESDIPNEFFALTIKIASCLYRIDQLINSSDANSEGSIESKSEADIKITYGSRASRISSLQSQIDSAIKELRSMSGKENTFYSIQVV